MKIEKVEKLLTNLHDKTKYVIHIRNIKQALHRGLVLEKVHKVIKFNQNAWLKPYIDMNTDLRRKAKKWFWKNLLKLINNSGFGKTMENVRKHRDIKLVTTERNRNYLASEPNFHTTKFFPENLLAIKIKSQNYKNCLEATQLENKMNYLEKNKRDNAFNEEINKIALSSNDDKRMQSYAYRTSKDLVSDKEEIKCNNIIKLYKNCPTTFLFKPWYLDTNAIIIKAHQKIFPSNIFKSYTISSIFNTKLKKILIYLEGTGNPKLLKTFW